MYKRIFILLSWLSFCLIQSHAQRFHQWEINLVDRCNTPKLAQNNWIQPYSNSIIYGSALTPAWFLAAPLFENKEKKWSKLGYEMGGIAAGMALNYAVTFSAKKLVQRPRPFTHDPARIDPSYQPKDFSFPSGHSSSAFNWATSIVLYAHFHYGKSPWWITVPAYTYATSIAVSRLVMGVHYPSDVVVGALIGTASSLISWKLTQFYYTKRG
jgi:undecaprenyl-diphosphatase